MARTWVRGHSFCEFMHDLHTAEIYQSSALSLLLTVLVYLHSIVHSQLQKEMIFDKQVRYGRKRSFKIIETGSNRQSICHFLLVFHCN